MKEKVEAVLAKIRPMLALDGGGVELVSVDEKNGIVKVRLTGACGCCVMSQMTLKTTVEEKLKAEIPEIKVVKAV